MRPSSVLLTIASSDEATIAARSDCASTLFSSARLVVDRSLLLSLEPPLRRAHGFAEDDHRDVREEVHGERRASLKPKAAEIPGRHGRSTRGEPPANGGEQGRAPAAHHTTNATAENIVASGNAAPIHGVSSWREDDRNRDGARRARCRILRARRVLEWHQTAEATAA